MKKILTIIVSAILLSLVLGSCASSRGGCPSHNPRYFNS